MNNIARTAAQQSADLNCFRASRKAGCFPLECYDILGQRNKKAATVRADRYARGQWFRMVDAELERGVIVAPWSRREHRWMREVGCGC